MDPSSLAIYGSLASLIGISKPRLLARFVDNQKMLFLSSDISLSACTPMRTLPFWL